MVCVILAKMKQLTHESKDYLKYYPDFLKMSK